MDSLQHRINLLGGAAVQVINIENDAIRYITVQSLSRLLLRFLLLDNVIDRLEQTPGASDKSGILLKGFGVGIVFQNIAQQSGFIGRTTSGIDITRQRARRAFGGFLQSLSLLGSFPKPDLTLQEACNRILV